ncbi:MAG: uracil phosphoribosyltransferase [Deltaproteobacteria bacterium]|nr:uracil phosphoribosyltransferase [Deltaproteobacteria bacterium]
MSSETAYESSSFRVAEIPHRYGPNVHLLDDPVAWTLLARASARETGQPEVGRLVKMLYEDLARRVVAAEFPRELARVPTRMVGSHPEAVIRSAAVAHRTPVVTVGIARAGTVPSQIVYELLNEIVDPALVRQDHLFMSREVNEKGEVTGARWHDAKIGREVGGKLVLFPDPMGATGSSMSSAITHYKTRLEGQPSKVIAINLIVTPEYLKRLLADHPDVLVYAVRLDRGLSSAEVLTTVPGDRWNEERGLNDHQYIVPGAGGVGEILNNSWV